MRKILFFNILLTIFLHIEAACQSDKLTQSDKGNNEKEIEYEINRNIATYRIAYNLLDHNFPWDPLPNPVRNNLLRRFAQYKNHNVVKLSNDLEYDDLVVTYLLHQKEFPRFGNKYDDQYLSQTDEYFIENREALARLYSELYQFYQEAEVERFIDDYEFYFNGAIKEIEEVVRQYDVVDQMEQYTKQRNKGYIICPEPLFLTGGTRGIGPRVRTDAGTICYQFISPSNQIDIPIKAADSLKVFGYDDPEYIRRMCVHEFGHSFVNPAFNQESVKQAVAEKESLFTEDVQQTLKHSGINNFPVFIIEHIVRTLEIRVADKYVSKEEAQQLRDANERFIYIPEMEKMLISQYEQKDTVYENFASVIPDLIKVIE